MIVFETVLKTQGFSGKATHPYLVSYLTWFFVQTLHYLVGFAFVPFSSIGASWWKLSFGCSCTIRVSLGKFYPSKRCTAAILNWRSVILRSRSFLNIQINLWPLWIIISDTWKLFFLYQRSVFFGAAIIG